MEITMLPVPKAMLVLGLAILTFFTINSTIPTVSCVDNPSVERSLREAAQKALNALNSAIGSTHTLSVSYETVNRGQHVFNNGLLGFHRSVLQDLLEQLGGQTQLENLMQDLIIPRDNTVRKEIDSMVVHFSSEEFYVNFNADLYGVFKMELQRALVDYLSAKTSDNQNDRYGIQRTRKKVQLIATRMADHSVYVDPMARDRWLHKNKREQDLQLYNQVYNDVKNMFQNILQDFQKVSDKISVFRKRNNWSWDQ